MTCEKWGWYVLMTNSINLLNSTTFSYGVTQTSSHFIMNCLTHNMPIYAFLLCVVPLIIIWFDINWVIIVFLCHFLLYLCMWSNINKFFSSLTRERTETKKLHLYLQPLGYIINSLLQRWIHSLIKRMKYSNFYEPLISILKIVNNGGWWRSLLIYIYMPKVCVEWDSIYACVPLLWACDCIYSNEMAWKY